MGGYVVCGSRDWPHAGLWLVTAKMIELIPEGSLVITGGARGVDEHAHHEAQRLDYQTKVIRADWERHGKRAGYVRNVAMLDENPVAVLAFCAGFSRGTMHAIREAMRREICLHWVKDEDLVHPEILALKDEWDYVHMEGQ
jgi:hypothetical protein